MGTKAKRQRAQEKSLRAAQERTEQMAQAVVGKRMRGHRKQQKLAKKSMDREELLQRIRSEFEKTGAIPARFECVTADGEIFTIFPDWHDNSEKAASFTPLRDTFRRRGVRRYSFAAESWISSKSGMQPSDDPERGEIVLVSMVDANTRRYVTANIERKGKTATLGPWRQSSEMVGWLAELLDEGYSDRAPKSEPQVLRRVTASELRELMDEHPEAAGQMREGCEMCEELMDLLDRQEASPYAIHVMLESALLGIVKDVEFKGGIGQLAQFIRDHPEAYPIFPSMDPPVPSKQHCERVSAALNSFLADQRAARQSEGAILNALMNAYLYVGSHVLGALELADRIENWSPEHQAKLQQVGLRSSFELAWDDGAMFMALSPNHSFGLMGRQNEAGERFITRRFNMPLGRKFDDLVQCLNNDGFEVITGPEAEDLLRRWEQAHAPTTDGTELAA